jgi:hypothetical protein
MSSGRHGATRPIQPDGYQFDMWRAIARHIVMFGETQPQKSAAKLIRSAMGQPTLASSRTLPIPIPEVAHPRVRTRCRSRTTRHASQHEVSELVAMITRIDS